MSTTKTTEMNNEEKLPNDRIKLDHKIPKARIKPQPIVAIKLTIEDKIKRLDNEGFDHNRIAAMLMCQKSLVKQVLA